MKKITWLLPLLLLAGLIVSVTLYSRASSHREKLETRLQAALAERQQTDNTLTETLAREDALRQQLTSLDAALGATKVRLTASDNRNIELARETARLRQELGNRDERLAVLDNELQTTKAALAQMQSLPVSPLDRARYETSIDRLKQELAETKAHLLTARSETTSPAMPAFTTNRGRTASVVSVGPANAFVVVNYGASHGALPTQTMQVRRGQDTLATVRISDVHPHHSVAQVLPDSLQGALHKGDLAILSPSAP